MKSSRSTNPSDSPSNISFILTWTGFVGIWSFWIFTCLTTFLAFEVILGNIGGGAIGKYKIDVLGVRFPTKHLVSAVFAGVIEVGSMAATNLLLKQKEDNDE